MSPSKRKTGHLSDWLGFLPFLLFCLAFEIVPVFFLARGSLVDKATLQLTGQHYLDLKHPPYVNSILSSIKPSGTAAMRPTGGEIYSY